MSNADGGNDGQDQDTASLPQEQATEEHASPAGDDWRHPSATPPPMRPTSRTPAPPPAVRSSADSDAAPSQLPGLAGFRARLRPHPSPASKTPAPPTMPRISRDPDGVPTPLTTLSSSQTPLASSVPMVPQIPASGTEQLPPQQLGADAGNAEVAGVDARPTLLRAPGRQGRYRELVMGAVAVISLVLLMAIGGGLLLGHGLLLGQHSGRPTPQANTPPTLTAEANAISTQSALLAHAGLQPLTTPYHIQVPGSCVDESGVWRYSYATPGHLKCLPTSLQLTAIGNSDAFLQFVDPYTGPMNLHYATNIHISQLQSVGCAEMDAGVAVSTSHFALYQYQVCGNGDVTIVVDQHIWYNGYFSPSSDLTMGLSYDGAHMMFTLNQRSISPYPVQITKPLLSILISLSTAPITSYNTPLTTGSTSADFSDFNYIPLP